MPENRRATHPAALDCDFAGWVVTEMGRQPFLVYGLLTVSDEVSATRRGEVLVGLTGPVVIDLALIGLASTCSPSAHVAGLSRTRPSSPHLRPVMRGDPRKTRSGSELWTW